LEAHLEATGSAKAAQVLADWPSWKSRFKLLVPPSEKVAMGLAPREAVAA
jgi:glutamate synthase (ferredoxin)